MKFISLYKQLLKLYMNALDNKTKKIAEKLKAKT